MEARLASCAVVAAAIASLGASHETTNFDVDAPTPEMARKIGDMAERYRHDLAIEWTGKVMPPWSRPCPIKAHVAPHLGAGGATSFLFERGEVFGWQMEIQGSLQRILDSVLPHEVTHTIFACHFRRALPRWADEGACTSVEHASERAKQQKMLIEFLKTGRGISFTRMFAMKEYPRDVLPLYSQGYSLACYLLAHGGKRKFLEFVGDGMKDENWPRAVRKHYRHDNMLALQVAWLDWVKRGSPPIDADPAPGPERTLIALDKGRKRPAPNLIFRAQSADPPAGGSERLVPVRPPVATRHGSPAPADLKPIPFQAAGEGDSPYPQQAVAANVPPPPSGMPERPRTTPPATRPPAPPAGPTPLASQQANTERARPNSATTAAEPGWQVLLEWSRPGATDSLTARGRHAAPLTMADRPASSAGMVR